MMGFMWCFFIGAFLATDGEVQGTALQSPDNQKVADSAPPAGDQAQGAVAALTQLNQEAYTFVLDKLNNDLQLTDKLKRINTIEKQITTLRGQITDAHQRALDFKKVADSDRANMNARQARNVDILQYMWPLVQKFEQRLQSDISNNFKIKPFPQVNKAAPATEDASQAAAPADAPPADASPADAEKPADAPPADAPPADAPPADAPPADAPPADAPPADAPADAPPADGDQPPAADDDQPPSDSETETLLAKKAVPQPNVAEAALQKIEEEGRMALKSSAPAPATPSIHGSNNAHDQMVDNALSAFTSQETSVKSPSEVLVAATQASAELVFWKYFALLMVSFNVCGFSIWAYNSSKSWDADLRSQKRPLL